MLSANMHYCLSWQIEGSQPFGEVLLFVLAKLPQPPVEGGLFDLDLVPTGGVETQIVDWQLAITSNSRDSNGFNTTHPSLSLEGTQKLVLHPRELVRV